MNTKYAKDQKTCAAQEESWPMPNAGRKHHLGLNCTAGCISSSLLSRKAAVRTEPLHLTVSFLEALVNLVSPNRQSKADH
jgi:hypothetical protein